MSDRAQVSMTDQRARPGRSEGTGGRPATGVATHPLECRLRRIEGQVRGVLHMLEQGRGTDEVLVQLASISGAIRGLEHQLVSVELDRVVDRVVRDGCPAAEGAIEDLKAAVSRLQRP